MDLKTPITTQEELDSRIKERLDRVAEKAARDEAAKYADYDELKAKAEKADEAAKRIADLERAERERKAADELREARAKAAKEAGVPVELVMGSTPEEAQAHARAIAEHYAPKPAPKVPEAGKFDKSPKAADATRDFVNRLVGRN